MEVHIQLATFMRRALVAASIPEVPASGEFVLPATRPVLFPGGVYGFAACLSDEERSQLFSEAETRGTTRMRDISEFRPLEGNLYGLYWGKDKQIGARPHQHLQNPVKTGAIRLSTYQALLGRKIACATLVVQDYASAERYMQHSFPCLLKTTNVRYVA